MCSAGGVTRSEAPFPLGPDAYGSMSQKGAHTGDLARFESVTPGKATRPRVAYPLPAALVIAYHTSGPTRRMMTREGLLWQPRRAGRRWGTARPPGESVPTRRSPRRRSSTIRPPRRWPSTARRGATSCSRRSTAAAWAPSSSPATAPSAARSPSRCCRSASPRARRSARRFIDEARIAGQLQHPGIPPVHDLGTLPDGRPFLAMKLIKGRTLDDHPPRPPRPGRRPRPLARRLRAGLPGRRLRPLPTRDPPRPQAGQRDGRRLRRGPGDGLGPGQGPGRRPRPPHGPGRRHRRAAGDRDPLATR